METSARKPYSGDETWRGIGFSIRGESRAPKKNRDTPDPDKRCRTETEEYRLVRVYIPVVKPDGSVQEILAAIDTQSNVSFAAPEMSIPRQWDDGEARMVKGFGAARTTTPRSVTVLVRGQARKLKARLEPDKGLSKGVKLLLSAQHCVELGIDVNHALRSEKHTKVRYLGEKDPRRRIRERFRKGHKKLRRERLESQVAARSCRIAERIMQEYLTAHDSLEGCIRRTVSLKDIKMGDHLSLEEKRQIRAVVEKYKDVFMESPDDVPPILKEVEPVEWRLKKDATPVRCKKPKWGPAQRKFLEAWTKQALEQGLIEPAGRSRWASRPVTVAKYRGDTPKGAIPDDIRVCIDYIAVNGCIDKTVDFYPDPQQLLRQAAGYVYYFAGDAQKQFWTIPLKKGITREMTAFWTPLGLVQYVRLPMGSKNASAIAQQIFDEKLQNLPESSRGHIVNFQDDFLGYANTVAEMLRHFEAFLGMCRSAGIRMNPAKVYIGMKKAKFYGFNLSEKGLSPAESNLDPIRKMRQPQDRSEVRSVLGVFNQFRNFIKRYDRMAKPLQRLLRKDVLFEWTPECEEGFQHIRKSIMKEDAYLAAPDKKLPLILETDGSDDGWGAVLLQQEGKERRVISMWSKQWKTQAMRKAPPYYKEAAAWMRGLELSRIYADAHPLPVRCITDHIPLTWVKHTSGKGPVSQFVLDNLSSINYTLEYRKGSDHVYADALSRFPCLGPLKLSHQGMEEAFKVLLNSVGIAWDVPGRVWVHAGKFTQQARDLVLSWRDKLPSVNKRRVPAVDRPSGSRIAQQKYALAILAPSAEKSAEVLQACLVKAKPFAVLVPISLVNRAPETEDERERLQQAKKIVLLDPELVWVSYDIPGTRIHEVHSRQVHTFGPEPDLSSVLTGPPTIDTSAWREPQEQYIAEQAEYGQQNTILSRGLWHYQLNDRELRLIVPPEWQAELCTWQHKALLHAGRHRVQKALEKTFHWTSLKSDARSACENCATCCILNAKRDRAHGHFRAKVYSSPRTVWSLDYYGVYPSKEGQCQILGAVDAVTSEVRLFATKERSAAVTTDCILQGIILRDGCPLVIHTDHAKEFVSKALRTLRDKVGIQQTTTLGHHPSGNGQIERLWQYVTKVLRQMTAEQHAHWQQYVRLMEHVWNTMTSSTLNRTPFELAHGLAARGVVDSLVPGPEYHHPGPMDEDGIMALGTTARAFEELARQAQMRDRSARAATANCRGGVHRFKVGDQVVFYIPPSAEEAKRAGRKQKHLPHYRGPATITEILSPSTYAMSYGGRRYRRSISELRRYRANTGATDILATIEQESLAQDVKKGDMIAFSESDDPSDKLYHIAEILEVDMDDQNVKVWQYATSHRDLSKAKFKKLRIWKRQVQNQMVHTYEAGGRSNHKFKPVIEDVPLPQENEDFQYIRAVGLKLLPSGVLDARSRRMLNRLGLQHHRLGPRGTYQ